LTTVPPLTLAGVSGLYSAAVATRLFPKGKIVHDCGRDAGKKNADCRGNYSGGYGSDQGGYGGHGGCYGGGMGAGVI
jgi:hypothetical protein